MPKHAELSVEHERSGEAEEVELQLRWSNVGKEYVRAVVGFITNDWATGLSPSPAVNTMADAVGLRLTSP